MCTDLIETMGTGLALKRRHGLARLIMAADLAEENFRRAGAALNSYAGLSQGRMASCHLSRFLLATGGGTGDASTEKHEKWDDSKRRCLSHFDLPFQIGKRKR